MCGICGAVTWGNAAVSADVIVAMRQTLVHRGPDDEGLYLSEDAKVGLGFRRLAIIDLSPNGNQPMSNEDGSVWISFNGEIYNHLALREALVRQGHVYRSKCDTESIIHLYEQQGLDAISHLDGMFAISLWDERRKRLLLVRDRLGVKPLYYAEANGWVVFGSEIKAILKHPEVRRELDPQALYHYLTFATTPAPMTLFGGIHKVAPGSMVVWENGQRQVRQYWEPLVNPDPDASQEDSCVERIQILLGQSVEKRMMSDVPFGVFLSGGIDSSTNVALMSRVSSQPVRTYSVAFRHDEAYNELQYARQIAETFHTDHHEVIIDQQELIDFLPALIHHQDEPIADPVCVPLYYVSKLARESGTIVVQVGEGADEIFSGYRHYVAIAQLWRRAWRHLDKVPGFMLQGAWTLGNPILQRTSHARFADFLRRASAGEELFWGGAVAYGEHDKHRLTTSAYRAAIGNPSSWGVVQDFYQRIDRFKDANYLERIIYLELKLRLAELLLMRVDKITMATSVEARVPFLDHRLVEFAMGIPMDLKIKDGLNKYILKKAVQGIIPDNIINRPKQGFGVPINEWFLQSLGNVLEEKLMNSSIHQLGFFDKRFIAERLNAQRSGRANYSFQLWNLFNLMLWYEYWIDGKVELAV